MVPPLQLTSIILVQYIKRCITNSSAKFKFFFANFCFTRKPESITQCIASHLLFGIVSKMSDWTNSLETADTVWTTV